MTRARFLIFIVSICLSRHFPRHEYAVLSVMMERHGDFFHALMMNSAKIGACRR
ncbi:MAG TPA: hypothetical protein P5183_07005 [Smithellaceae bacterium]|nr:hypothetical protein [Smithellaceae bacterium]